jgi:cephalosporin-C deacetylase
MAFFDLPLEQLKTYRPAVAEPADFEAFWQSTLAENRATPLNATFEKVDYGLTSQETYDVTFSGFGGQPIKGWLLLPVGRKGPLPCVVEYIGYGGGRSFPFDWLLWSSAGFAWAGQRLAPRRYPRSLRRRRQSACAGQHDRWDPRPSALLLPPRHR